MAEAVVSFLLERIADFLKSEANIFHEVSDEVEDLKKELRLMQSFLKDNYNKTYESETMDNLVAEIREIVYDAEDILEPFTAKFEARRRQEETTQRIRNKISKLTVIPKEIEANRKARSKIKDINERISNLNSRLKTYDKSAAGDAHGSRLRHERLDKLRRVFTHVKEDVDDFVGFHQDVEMLAANLVDENKHSRVVSIYGMGGVGKTTVAKRVYHHPKVRSYFDRFAWVYVSKHWEKKDTLGRIVLELERFDSISQKLHWDIDRNLNWSYKICEKQLYIFQKECKCLIVLDDIWDRNDWDLLKSAFPFSSTKSKLLITTRKEDVGRYIDGKAFLHKLRCLNEEESWELLKKKAFAGRQLEDYTEMEKNGRKMIRGCGGLPLAIKVLGGVLVGKNPQEWVGVLNRMYLILEKGQGVQQEDGTVQQVLDLSYDDLPSQIKRCFLYMGNLGDYSIEGEKLCLLWIAENLISNEDKGGGETMMDAAQRYLNELEQRSMVEKETSDDPSYWDFSGNQIFSVRKYEASTNRRVESFRLHDLVRILCLTKKECFFKTIDFQSQENVPSQGSSSSSTSSTKTRRMAIIQDRDGKGWISSQQHGASEHLRSLLFLIINRFFERQFLPEIPDFKKFKLLRVLDIKGFKGNITEEIGKLILLKYLAFTRNELSVLPSSICKLQYLQTLDLSGFESISIPNMLGSLKKLWHLYVPRHIDSIQRGPKLRLDGLNELETLEYFNPDYFYVADLMKLSNLRRLAAYMYLRGDPRNLDSMVNFLNDRPHKIQKLCLTAFLCYGDSEEERSLQQVFRCRILHKLALLGSPCKLPEYNIDSYSSSLTHISLNGTNLVDDPMATLEKLPYLEFLLMTRAYNGTEMVCSAVGFPKLRILLLEGFSKLEKWKVDEGAMPNLSCLEITNCPRLEMLPEGLRFLTALRELTIALMSEAFLNRVQVKDGVAAAGEDGVAAAGEDVYKIRHVPFITFVPRYLILRQ